MVLNKDPKRHMTMALPGGVMSRAPNLGCHFLLEPWVLPASLSGPCILSPGASLWRLQAELRARLGVPPWRQRDIPEGRIRWQDSGVPHIKGRNFSSWRAAVTAEGQEGISGRTSSRAQPGTLRVRTLTKRGWDLCGHTWSAGTEAGEAEQRSPERHSPVFRDGWGLAGQI